MFSIAEILSLGKSDLTLTIEMSQSRGKQTGGLFINTNSDRPKRNKEKYKPVHL
jgi:hypothetical protein